MRKGRDIPPFLFQNPANGCYSSIINVSPTLSLTFNAGTFLPGKIIQLNRQIADNKKYGAQNPHTALPATSGFCL
jgi:hypothetical protein